ncbi:hypothetical protein JQN64_28625, partial [Escherichia coli]|nr:hypothetical protein [Escherichia coli]
RDCHSRRQEKTGRLKNVDTRRKKGDDNPIITYSRYGLDDDMEIESEGHKPPDKTLRSPVKHP